jgi:hypothetical protein
VLSETGDREFILKHLTVEEMEQIMGPEQVRIARQEMGLPPLPDRQDEDAPKRE